MSRFEEWNTKLLSLTPEEFEDLCYELIEAEGFINLEWIKGGKDRGRDIIAERIERKPGFTIVTEKWFFQCKRYRSGIPVDKISSAIDWAIADKASYYIVISNSYLTSECKEYVKKKKEQTQLKILEWTNKKFQKILFRHPRIVESFFPQEKIPESERIAQPQKIFEVTLTVPTELNRELQEEFVKLMPLEEKERNEKMFKLIKEKVIDSPNLDPNIRALVYQQLSVVSFNKGDLKEAVFYLDEALKITPENRIVLMNKGFLLEKMKRYGESVACYDKVLKLNSDDKIAWNAKGHNLEKLHKHKGAIFCFEKAVKIDPNFIIARNNIGVVFVKENKYKEATRVYDETLSISPNSKTTLNKKADLLKELKDFKGAYARINKALEIDPYFVDGLNTKGVILEHCGGYYEDENKRIKFIKLALETFEKVIELDNKHALGRTNVIVCLLKLGEVEKALECANKTVEDFPDEEFAWMRKASVLQDLRKYDEALICIKKALKINPYHKASLAKKGIIYLGTKKFKKALRVANEMNRFYPRYAKGWKLKGDAFAGLGKNDKAEKCYRRAKGFEIPLKSLIENFI